MVLLIFGLLVVRCHSAMNEFARRRRGLFFLCGLPFATRQLIDLGVKRRSARLAPRLRARLLRHVESRSQLGRGSPSLEPRKRHPILCSLQGRLKFFCGAHAGDALFLPRHRAGTVPGWH